MAKIEDIIMGLNQAAHLGYDGALDDDGERREIGLAREEGDPILDPRVMDGFKVRFAGKQMILSYQTETMLKDVYDRDFEAEMKSRVEDIASYLKKQYKAVMGENVSLTLEGEIQVLVQHISNTRTWANVTAVYNIGNVTDFPEDKDEVQEKLTKAVENWISQGKK